MRPAAFLCFGGAVVAERVPLASLTTLRVGPVARRVITCTTSDQIVATLRTLDQDSDGDVLVLAGGSNVVIADDLAGLTVVRLANAASAFNYISTPVNNRVDLRGYGIPGNSYDVQKSSDLVNWNTISLTPITAAANGMILFTDPNANTSPRYYRFAVH